jgi:hypothetical protein
MYNDIYNYSISNSTFRKGLFFKEKGWWNKILKKKMIFQGKAKTGEKCKGI